jgi:hypothetical protein
MDCVLALVHNILYCHFKIVIKWIQNSKICALVEEYVQFTEKIITFYQISVSCTNIKMRSR